MRRHLQRDLDDLSRELLTMGAMVEDATNKAIAALLNRDSALAHEVIEGDAAINEKENHLEEQALKILALHQPVAEDVVFMVEGEIIRHNL